MQKLLTFFSFLLFITGLVAQHTTSHLQGIDVLSYEHYIEVSDSNNVIYGKTIVLLNKGAKKNFFFDLENLDEDGKGMQVSNVNIIHFTTSPKHEDITFFEPCKFKQQREKLHLTLKSNRDSILQLEINYSGIPRDGLVIGKNKYGNRTFFGDNWPNRAHQWFPCLDHPSDKAKVTFHVTSPSNYSVIANGAFKENILRHDEKFRTVTYESKKELPTKVMVVGIAELESDTVECHHDFHVTSLVYPENKKEGFHDFAIADSVLDFFIQKIGTYPFEKLANVQSTTRFGGMENAGCIFYDEHSISGKRTNENLIVHEIAHQWFGNSASEKDWRHLWLSEGFATYLTICYVEEKYGKEKMYEMLEKDKQKVIRFHNMNPRPIVDTTSNYISLLNPNSYQKGSWFLHMLRHKVGDELFWKGIKKYYETYQYSNASTDDFLSIMQDITGNLTEDPSPFYLESFFNNWLKQAEHLKLDLNIQYSDTDVLLNLKQLQKEQFSTAIDIRMNFEDGTSQTVNHFVRVRDESFSWEIEKPIKSIEIDPEYKLLYEINLKVEKLK